ncbi:RNA/RNP complex-1-interacting phosphatase-like [Chiloscyllium punctatum]|uniref:RNA/RNP complex-1-interacting phosphatase-like n=1 Tax=Chiloscyllium punctatum TaxID=137246 RepID=UPI003B63D78E
MALCWRRLPGLCVSVESVTWLGRRDHSGRSSADRSQTMSKNKIPDRWQKYSAVGRRLPGTRFIAFKVPLNKIFERHLQPCEFFSPTDLFRQIKEQREELGKIIDLTFTKRYYDPQELPEGLVYKKIFTAGHEVPTAKTILTFKQAVQNFLSDNKDNDKLVGVHCTHGVNRTGYLICRYLIDVDGMEPHNAINLFNQSRGYQIERQNYIQDLLQGPCQSNKGIGARGGKQKESHIQQPKFKQQERLSKGKYPKPNGFREFSQFTCPPRQSAHPFQPVQHPKGQVRGAGAWSQTIQYNGKTMLSSNRDYGEQELALRNCQTKTSRWGGQPEASRWSGQAQASRWGGQAQASGWSGQLQASQWDGQPEASRWGGRSDSWQWNNQPPWQHQNYQQPWHVGRGNKGWKLNSGAQAKLNTHLRWDN